MEWFWATTPVGVRDTTFGWLKDARNGMGSWYRQKKQIKMPKSFILRLNERDSRREMEREEKENERGDQGRDRRGLSEQAFD